MKRVSTVASPSKKLKIVQILIWTILFVGVNVYQALGQDKTSNKFGKGIKIIAADSSFSLNFSLRIQTLYQGVYDKESHMYDDRFLIRRSRLKFSGFAYSPKLEYKVELGLSNADISNGNIPQTGNTANYILDAVLKYNFVGNWSLWFGQTKLPGNIERVISSGGLQFVDRSNLNSRYNIDRDAGLQLRYEAAKFRWIGSISGGEGRNITTNNSGGYDYTNRIEWLPLGEFSGNSEYSAADLKREKKPKLFLALTYDYNNHASRQSGQLGKFLTEQRSLKTWFADLHFKYQGVSTMIEYVEKSAVNGNMIIDSNTDTYVDSYFTGSGLNVQTGYLFKNNVELAGRYTAVNPDKSVYNGVQHRFDNKQYTVGVSKYWTGHSLKLQADATLIKEDQSSDEIMYRVQVDFSL